MENRILLCLNHMGGTEMDYVQKAFDDNWVVPLGPDVVAFEQALQQYLEPGDSPKRVVALSSGTAAVHLALKALGVGPGDEVIAQSFTFCASVNPIIYLGAKPVLVDSEAETWNMDPRLLDLAIRSRIAATGRKPKAIVVVHLYGMPAKMDQICAVAQRYGIPVVEDAAEALGSCYKGRKCGTIGKYGILSFNGNKMITTSGGGALVCPDEAARDRAMFFATQAREPYPYYQHEEIGYNYRLSNISAAIGRGQMDVLEEHIAHHRMLAGVYAERFADMTGIEFHGNPSADFDANFWLNTILISPELEASGQKEANPGLCEPNPNVEAVRVALAARNIETRPLWKPLHKQPAHRCYSAFINGTSERLFSQGLCLPSGPYVTADDANHICDLIKKSLI